METEGIFIAGYAIAVAFFWLAAMWICDSSVKGDKRKPQRYLDWDFILCSLVGVFGCLAALILWLDSSGASIILSLNK